MFQRVLVAIDDTEQTGVTISFAISIARECRSTVRLCMVNPFRAGSRGIPLLTDDEAADRVIDAIEQFRREGIASSGCVYRSHHRRVADHIVSEAEETAADAIVLGQPRSRGLTRLLSSGVAERAVRLTSLPILMAPPTLNLPLWTQLDLHELTEARERQQTSSEQ